MASLTDEGSWSHDNPEWQKTLALARKYGWTSKKASNHGGLQLHCPSGAVNHRLRVYSTGKGSESVARSARRKIQNCAHRDLSQPIARIEASLDGSESLLDAAERVLDLEDAEAQMEQFLDLLDDAEEELARLELRFDEAAAVSDRARSELQDGDLEQPPGAHLAAAQAHLRDGQLTLRDDLPKSADRWQDLKNRHDQLVERLAALRDRRDKGL